MAFVAQDDARENRIVDLFNLARPANRARHGTDAILLIDGHELEFELKSVTRPGGSVSTVRDLGRDHIRKWRNKHWIVAFHDGAKLIDCRYGTPDDMAPWINQIWEYIRTDFEMAQLVPALITMTEMNRILGAKESYTYADAKLLQKNQLSRQEYKARMDQPNGYSPDRMLELLRERVKYVIERGSTLNNPHIPARFFRSWVSINAEHASLLRRKVRAWLKERPPEALALDSKT